MLTKLKALIKRYPRVVYEIKSFLLTFAGVYVMITGISETTTMRSLLDNYQMFVGSISIAAFRTFIIFVLKVVDYDYRASTAKYK